MKPPTLEGNTMRNKYVMRYAKKVLNSKGQPYKPYSNWEYSRKSELTRGISKARRGEKIVGIPCAFQYGTRIGGGHFLDYQKDLTHLLEVKKEREAMDPSEFCMSTPGPAYFKGRIKELKRTTKLLTDFQINNLSKVSGFKNSNI
jgi:hypothetical protein